MDLFDSMRVFVRVVERGSFSAVARELNMGQPAVSKQIRALEQYLGGPVFARSTRHLALTDQGQRFYSHCQEILGQVESATRSFASGQWPGAGRRPPARRRTGQLRAIMHRASDRDVSAALSRCAN